MSSQDDVSNLIKDFVSKAKVSSVSADDDMSEYTNGQILEDNDKYLIVYSMLSDKRELKLFKDYSKNTISTLQLFLKTMNIKLKGKIKKDLIEQVEGYFNNSTSIDEEDDDMEDDESSEDEEMK
jgi:hypothetical protein